MVFRVSTYQTSRVFIDQIVDQRSELEKTRREVSSGLKVVDPSDDPARAGTIADFQIA